MYNDIIKSKYIKTITNQYTKDSCISTFNRVEKFEIMFQKDIYEMSEMELSKVLNDIVIIRSGTTNKGGQVTILQNYVGWCLDNKIYNSNDNIFKIEIDPTEKIKTVMLKNPEQLDATLNAIFKPVDKCTIDNVYRCAVWLIYSGIKKCDLKNIEESNFDFDNMKIKYNSKTYDIYIESVDSIKSCINLKSFNIIHPSYTDGYGIDERFNGNSILRTTTGDIKPDTLQQLINRKIKSAESNGVIVKKIKIDKIRLSGIFYRAYKYESQGVDIDFSYIAKSDVEDKEYKTSKRVTLKTIILNKSREYNAEYCRWKEALYNN